MVLRTLALGQSHLRGVSVPRTSQKAYVAEEIFAYSWDRALMAYRVSSFRAGESSRRCEDTGYRVIRSPPAFEWYTTALPEQAIREAL